MAEVLRWAPSEQESDYVARRLNQLSARAKMPSLCPDDTPMMMVGESWLCGCGDFWPAVSEYDEDSEEPIFAHQQRPRVEGQG